MANEGSESQADMAAAEPEMEEAVGEEASEEAFESAEAEIAPAEEAMADEVVEEAPKAEMVPAEEPSMAEAAGEAASAPPVEAIEKESEGVDEAMMAEADQEYTDESAAAEPLPVAPADDNTLSMTAPAESESADAARSGVAPTASPPPPAPVAKEEALPQDIAEAEEEAVEEKMVGGAEAPSAPDMEDTDTTAEEHSPQIEATATEPVATNTPVSALTATPLIQATAVPTVASEARPTEAISPVNQPGWMSPRNLFVGVIILSALVILIVAVLIIWISTKNKNR